jgi:hypothetical protein
VQATSDRGEHLFGGSGAALLLDATVVVGRHLAQDGYAGRAAVLPSLRADASGDVGQRRPVG